MTSCVAMGEDFGSRIRVNLKEAKEKRPDYSMVGPGRN